MHLSTQSLNATDNYYVPNNNKSSLKKIKLSSQLMFMDMLASASSTSLKLIENWIWNYLIQKAFTSSR